MLIRMFSRTARRMSAVLIAAIVVGFHPDVSQAKECDLTGTLDCDVRSGKKCEFIDWETGPRLGILTRDISGNLERATVDASWVRDDLSDFGQDDFVWFTVQDFGTGLQATSVLE